ncbi:MAG: SH3 domain-containing protein [Clostridia bacterium]|nr:SH3 domain-containing protein [Clostridia bacterium]
MMKKLIALMLVLMSALTMCFSVAGAENLGTKTMYVYTENLGTLNVRRDPIVKNGNVIGELEYGAKVTVLVIPMVNADWTAIRYSKGNDGVAYVMTRFLSATKPDMSKKEAQQKQHLADLEELNRQIATFKPLDRKLKLITVPPRTSGWMNFRKGPGVASERIASFPDGRALTAIGETAKWYQVIDDATGQTGYVSKLYVNVMGMVEDEPAKAEVKPAANATESLGKLTVNGEFALQCKLPEGYEIQVVNMRNTKVVASITNKDAKKPVMYLSIAYNELYSNVDRLNDLNAEDLKALENTFTEMNVVDITYRETAYGTKLMVVKESENDTDFVDFFTIYKGYNVEFIVTPGEGMKGLTNEQIKTSIDFLTDLDFVEVK